MPNPLASIGIWPIRGQGLHVVYLQTYILSLLCLSFMFSWRFMSILEVD